MEEKAGIVYRIVYKLGWFTGYLKGRYYAWFYNLRKHA